MTIPTVKVEIAFNAGYSTPAADRVWTNVTQYVLAIDGIDITHGRGDERSQADANSVNLTFINDGRFTPGLATSPYYPNVKIGRPIRVTSTPAGGTATTRYVGFIDEWPLEWPAVVTTFATSAISATSRMAWLGADRTLKSIVEEEILLDIPAAYYTLGEAEGATTAADSSGNSAPSLVMAGTGTAVVFGTATGPGTDGLTAASFADGKYLAAVLATYPAVTASFAVEAFFSTSGTGAILVRWGDLNLQVDLTGKLFVSVGGGGATVQSTSTVNNGATRHGAVVCTVTGSNITAVDLYVDGTITGTSWAGSVANSTRPDLRVGNSDLTGAMAHVALFGSALSATRVAAHANSGLTGFVGDTPAARLTRYAAYAAVPAAEIAADTGTPPMAHVDTTGQSVMDMLRIVETTESGVLFDGRDGTLQFRSRSSRYNTAAAVTLDASAGQIEASYASKMDRSAVLNDVTATLSSGTVSARAEDTASVRDYGRKDLPLELATTDVNEPHAAAWWRVNTYAEPRARAPQLGVEIAALSTALQAQILALTVGSKITVTGLPSQSDAASKSFFVEGYTERIGAATHTFEFNVSPTTGFDVWAVEDPVYGAMDEFPIAY